MKIQDTNYSHNLSFSARNKNIRKADDIQRRAMQTFPMISASRFQANSPFLNDKKDTENGKRAEQIIEKIRKEIKDMRMVYASPFDYGYRLSIYEKSTPFAFDLNMMKERKFGNCYEASIAVLAGLTANGFYDSKRANLSLEVKFINKNTGKVEFTKREDLDHTVVLTKMNKNSKKEDDLIVVDGWMGFADTVSNAKLKYKQTYNPKRIDEIINSAKKMFLSQVDNADLNDYDIKTDIVFEERDFLNSNAMELLGIYSETMIDELLLSTKKPQNIPANS